MGAKCARQRVKKILYLILCGFGLFVLKCVDLVVVNGTSACFSDFDEVLSDLIGLLYGIWNSVWLVSREGSQTGENAILAVLRRQSIESNKRSHFLHVERQWSADGILLSYPRSHLFDGLPTLVRPRYTPAYSKQHTSSDLYFQITILKIHETSAASVLGPFGTPIS